MSGGGGGFESLASNLISSAAHKFLNIDPSTGAIIGAIAGNLWAAAIVCVHMLFVCSLFNLGGKHNSLSGVGKLVLDNLLSGKFRRKASERGQKACARGDGGCLQVEPFVSPTPGVKSFNLDFARERDRCLRERVLFEDPEFPANDRSLFYSKAPKQRVEWLRPAVRFASCARGGV